MKYSSIFGSNLALLEKGYFSPIAVLESILSLERMKIDFYFVANLSKLMLQNNLDKWLNGHHNYWNDAHDRSCFEELCKTASEKKTKVVVI